LTADFSLLVMTILYWNKLKNSADKEANSDVKSNIPFIAC